ncbi:MAG: alpha/beta hydrolase [Flavobacteriaceae bacterium]|nr:alpha/beta hydrolase [Flavobacteriaceae bacterium]
MKTIKNHIILFYGLTFLLFLSPLLGNAQVISKEPKDLFIVGTESINFHSEINNSEYKLYVNLPEGYDENSNKKYPVFYALDGYRIFGITTRIYKGLIFDGFVPEMIIIGINNSGAKDTNPTLHRTRDLTPTPIERLSTSGGAANFLKVLSDEIIPLVERTYKTDKTNRTLVGTSHAGMFAHYTLFKQPSLFNNYIINNATFDYDDGYSYRLEEEFYQKNKSIKAKVLLVSSEFDDMPSVTKMVEQIKKNNYSGLTLDFRMVENMGHLGGEAEAVNQGMRFAYNRPTVMLSEEELKEYCGTYKDGAEGGTYTREVIIRDGELFLVRNKESEGAKIQSIGESKFSLLGNYLDFHFNRNEKGEVISFYYQWSSNPTRAITALKIK